MASIIPASCPGEADADCVSMAATARICKPHTIAILWVRLQAHIPFFSMIEAVLQHCIASSVPLRCICDAMLHIGKRHGLFHNIACDSVTSIGGCCASPHFLTFQNVPAPKKKKKEDSYLWSIKTEGWVMRWIYVFVWYVLSNNRGECMQLRI